MEKTSWRARGLEWFTSHALWEAAKFGLTAFFVWLVSRGLSRMTGGATFNIFLVMIGVIGLAWIFGFIPAIRKVRSGPARSLGWELAELTERGHQLLTSTPRAGASPSDLMRFWDEEVGRWTSETATTLLDTLGKESSEFFLSTTGLNMEQPLQQIHPEAKNTHLRVARWLQNLEQLRQTLPKN